jgi:protein-tyrosine phosphatase
VVNCRARTQTLLSQDLAVERALFGEAHVAHAPMWDTGRRKHPRRWSAAARFVPQALDEDDAARVLIHCQTGSLAPSWLPTQRSGCDTTPRMTQPV